MPPDQELVAETQSWLERAKEDLRASRVLLDAQPPVLRGSLFHSQQAAEKGLKAFLTWHSQPFRKTHSIEELGHACTDILPALKEVIDPSVILTEYAWRFRYPGDIDDPTDDEANEALRIAGTLIGAIVGHLPFDLTE